MIIIKYRLKKVIDKRVDLLEKSLETYFLPRNICSNPITSFTGNNFPRNRPWRNDQRNTIRRLIERAVYQPRILMTT